MNGENYQVVERAYAVQFHFKNKADAKDFKLPKEYAAKFELNNNLDKDNHTYIRIAQIR
jgi:hypothetical protein